MHFSLCTYLYTQTGTHSYTRTHTYASRLTHLQQAFIHARMPALHVHIIMEKSSHAYVALSDSLALSLAQIKHTRSMQKKPSAFGMELVFVVCSASLLELLKIVHK